VARSRRRRWPFVAAALVGVGLIAAPAIFGLFTKSPKGCPDDQQLQAVHDRERLNGYQRDLHQIDAGVSEVDAKVAPALDGCPAGPAAFAHFRGSHPDFASFDRQWPTINLTMERLMNSVQGNLGNYEAVAALPSFNLFPYFFVVPGLLILAFALLGLRRTSTTRWPVIALVVMGVGLIAAPAIFQSKERGVGWIRRERADRDRVGVEAVVLNDRCGSCFSGVIAGAGHRPDLGSSQSSGQMDTESTKA
jgi:hypothetical protein